MTKLLVNEQLLTSSQPYTVHMRSLYTHKSNITSIVLLVCPILREKKPDDAESADRKRQRLNSEQDESQTTPTENDNEQREDTEQTSSNSQSGLIVEATPLTESEIVPIEADKSSAETASKFFFVNSIFNV